MQWVFSDFCFVFSWSPVFIFPGIQIHRSIFLHCTKRGLQNRQYSPFIRKNGIRKVRKGVEIFDKRILVLVSSSGTQWFRIRPRFWQVGGGREPKRKPSFSALLFFISGVYCHVIPNKVLFSHKKLKGVV